MDQTEMTHGAKRRLKLSDEEVSATMAKKIPTSANTAIEVTEFADRQQAVAKVNKGSNKKQGKFPNKTLNKNCKGPKSGPMQAGKANEIQPSLIDSKNNNAIPDKGQLSAVPRKQFTQDFAIPGCSSQENERPQTIADNLQSMDQLPINEEFPFDGVHLQVNAGEDDFNDDSDEDEVRVLPIDRKQVPNEEIPPEVIEQLTKNAALKEYFSNLVEAGVDARMKAREKELQRQKLPPPPTPRRQESSPLAARLPPVDSQGAKGQQRRKTGMVDNSNVRMPTAQKSPSDTTIYRPALVKGLNETNEVINKISNFVESIRLGSTSKHTTLASEVRKFSKEKPVTPSTSGKEEAEKIIIDADQLKVKLPAPKGRIFDLDNHLSQLEKYIHNFDDDDEFFHVACHVGATLRGKIARGEFVDLEQLLPKDRNAAGMMAAGAATENRVELVSSGGHTYFKLIKETQINGLRKWEKAFRVYAVIYTENNPQRATEIWQYMHTINIAASSYQWENVASYDLTFRQLMAFKPQRSWAKLYHQGWNLAMRDPINKANHSSSSNNNVKSNNGSRKDWREDCCWKYNRNRCKKTNCDYDHHCTYCGGWNHGYYNCRKRLGKHTNNSNGKSEGKKHHSLCKSN